MSDACRDTPPCYNSSRLPVTVPEDEIWPRDAAAGEYPVSCCDGKKDITVFSDTLQQIFDLVWTQFAKSSPVRHFCNVHRLIMTSKTALAR